MQLQANCQISKHKIKASNKLNAQIEKPTHTETEIKHNTNTTINPNTQTPTKRQNYQAIEHINTIKNTNQQSPNKQQTEFKQSKPQAKPTVITTQRRKTTKQPQTKQQLIQKDTSKQPQYETQSPIKHNKQTSNLHRHNPKT